MLEVAEAIQYLHSEGMVHGDLHGVCNSISNLPESHLIVYQGNVLLDSDFHCQITDFGLTRCSEATVAWTTKTFVAHYAAPELFGMCSVCNKMGCDGCHPEHRTTKTLETDVYAFGCLYYEVRLMRFVLVFFGTLRCDLHRHSSMLFLLRGNPHFKLWDASRVDCVQSD